MPRATANAMEVTITTKLFCFTESQLAQVIFLHSARTVFSHAPNLWKTEGLSLFFFSGFGFVF